MRRKDVTIEKEKEVEVVVESGCCCCRRCCCVDENGVIIDVQQSSLIDAGLCLKLSVPYCAVKRVVALPLIAIEATIAKEFSRTLRHDPFGDETHTSSISEPYGPCNSGRKADTGV